MKNVLRPFYLIVWCIFIVSSAAASMSGEDKPLTATYPDVKTEYTATEKSQLLKEGCELFLHIKGITHEGTLIVRIKEDFSPKVKKMKKAIHVKALEPCCPRFEIFTAHGSGNKRKRIVTSDEREAASYKKRGAEVNQIYGDGIRYAKYPDDHEEILLFFLPTRRMAKLPSAMTTKRMFMDVFNFSYGDFFHSIEQLVYFDELQFGREIITVKKRHFKDVRPGIFLWMTSD